MFTKQSADMHIARSGNHSFKWKPFFSVEAIPSNGSHSFSENHFN